MAEQQALHLYIKISLKFIKYQFNSNTKYKESKKLTESKLSTERILVLGKVADRWRRSRSELKSIGCQIGGPSCHYTQTVNLGTVQCKFPYLFELGRLSAGWPAGPLGNSYNAPDFEIW